MTNHPHRAKRTFNGKDWAKCPHGIEKCFHCRQCDPTEERPMTGTETAKDAALRIAEDVIAERDRLKAENARLRAALYAAHEHILDQQDESSCCCPDCNTVNSEYRARAEAEGRAALAETAEGGGK